MKSISKLAAVVALSLSASVFAAPVANQKNSRNMKPSGNCSPKPPTSCECPCYPDCALPCDFPIAYNKNARIDTDPCGLDLFMDASFIYWNVSQDNMDIGRTAVAPDAAAPDASIPTQDFDYKPGFKIGGGLSSTYDNWQVEAVYTWLHQKNDYHTGSSVASFVGGDPTILTNDWFVHLTSAGHEPVAAMNSHWTMNMDLVDVLLSRPFYQGQRLTITPYTGLSALFMRQKFHINAIFPTGVTTQVAMSHNRSRFWSVGPSLGADFHWLIGAGFRVELDAGASILYARYTKVKHTETFDAAAVQSTGPINGHMPVTGTLRALNTLGLGFGWGSYFWGNDFHLDLIATYDFKMLWNQNMMRQLVGALADNFGGRAEPIGNLYLHGLTFTARFDY
jgi:hypothetical protein